MHPQPHGAGWIEIICGSMFSGKTQELIRRLRLAIIARQRVQAFKSALDVRYGRTHLVSHDRARIPSISVRTAEEILRRLEPDTQVVGMDEAHFLGPDLPQVCEQLADGGRRVIVAGLDTDYRGEPFEPMARLMAVAEYVTKNLAICTLCGGPAHRSRRTSTSRRRFDVGHADKYEARCRRCFRG